MSGLAALRVLMQSIVQENDEDLKLALDRINIPKLSEESSMSLLNRLLTTSFEARNPSAIRIIIEAFEPNYVDRYSLPILCQILMSQSFSDEVVAYVMSVYPEESYLSLANSFIEGEDDANIMAGLVRLEDLRGPLEVEDYRSLFDTASDAGNSTAFDFFAYILDERGEYQEIPSWVRNFTRESNPEIIVEEELPQSKDIIYPQVGPFSFTEERDLNQTVNILTNGIRASGMTMEDEELAREDLRKKLAGASLEEKREILQEPLESKAIADLSSNEEFFILYGPSNLVLGADTSSPCAKYGGCRMFTCIEFEDFLDPDEGDPLPIESYPPQEWFTGSCQWCHRRIRRPWHAIRKPLDHGGWKGCYCSEEHVRLSIGEATEEGEILSLALLDNYVESLNEIGVQDRLGVMKI